MIKLVVSDLDGTLLNSEKTISKENILAVKKLKENEVAFCIATGRLHASAKGISDKMDNEFPIISCNGALVKDIKNNLILHMKGIPSHKALQINKAIEELGIRYHFYTETSVFTKELSNSALWYHTENSTQTKEENKVNVVITENMEEMSGKTEGILKFIAFPHTQSLKILLRKKLSDIGNLTISQSSSENIEIMMEGVSKGNAIKKMLEIYNLDIKNVMVMGDQSNDLSMFECAKMKIAMDNGTEQLKNASTFISKSNDENGVAYAINKLILKEESEKCL
ncbi:MAG: Cof-type HAD-IIB family hydrolase [Proteocatella sp.]